jgi:hypothetical protein
MGAMLHNGKLYGKTLKLAVKHKPNFMVNLERLATKQCMSEIQNILPYR